MQSPWVWGASTFPAGPLRVIIKFVDLSTRDNMNEARKPRPKETGTLIGVRLQARPLDALDTWIAAQPEPRPSRPEAMRVIVADWMTAHGRL